MIDPLEAILRFTKLLDTLEVDYFLGGSAASSIHGDARSTQDLDFVVALAKDKIDDFVAALGDNYYSNPDQIKDAVEQGNSFNILLLDQMYKIDIFPLRDDEVSQSEMARRQRLQLSDKLQVWVSSPEDTIIKKILWFVQSDKTLNQQWQDILGVIKAQGNALDNPYLKRMAVIIGEEELLRKALDEGDLGACE